MRNRMECPGPADRHAIFDDQQAVEWMCQHQLQLRLQPVAETEPDERTKRLAAFQNYLFATALLKEID